MHQFETLKKVKEDFEAVLGTFGSAMVLVDKENKIIHITKEAQEQFGFSQNEELGKDWVEQVPAENLVGPIDPSNRPSLMAIITGKIKSSVFIIQNKKTNTPTITNVIATPIILNGEVACSIVILKKIEKLGVN